MLNFKTKRSMPLFQIHLADSEAAREIFKLTHLSYYIIKVENYNRPSRTMQCFRCQYFHHASTNCKMTPRCVKCAAAHETRDCPLGKGKIEKITCCNCGADHPASYRGCPKFPENIRKAFVAKKTTPSTSYASLLKPTAPQPATPAQIQSSQSNPDSINELSEILNAIAQEFHVNNFSQLVTKFRNTLQLIRNTPDQLGKLSVLSEALQSQPSLSP